MRQGRPKPARRLKRASLPACAVLLAGGRGTRFWPRSRVRTPKQLLNIVGSQTMVRETMARLSPLFAAHDTGMVTKEEGVSAIRRQLPEIPASHVLAEPIGVNTAAAIGLAAGHLVKEHDDAVMVGVPSAAYIGDATAYRKLVSAAVELARTPGNLVVLGIP